jgi:hypothetical protein
MSTDHFDDQQSLRDSCPTMRVEVPCIRQQPQPCYGYGYHARSPKDTDISSIPEEQWDTVVVVPSNSYTYIGQRTLDSSTVNVWFYGEDDGFFAQSLQGC